MASKLGLEPEDIRKVLNAKDEPFGFMGSQDETTDPADVAESILEEEEIALGRLNGRHFELTTYCSGQWLSRGAKGDGTETSFVLGLFPASKLRLYLDYSGRPWTDRAPCDTLTETTDYTFTPSTGAIELKQALGRGQTLIAEYEHTALSKCLVLRGIVKKLVVVEWARRLYPDDQKFSRYLEWEKQAYGNLARLRKKDGEKLGIKMFDDLSRDLVDETFEPRSTSEAYDADGSTM